MCIVSCRSQSFRSSLRVDRFVVVICERSAEEMGGGMTRRILIYSRLKSHSAEISDYTRRNVHSWYDFSLKCLTLLRYGRHIECSCSHECEKAAAMAKRGSQRKRDVSRFAQYCAMIYHSCCFSHVCDEDGTAAERNAARTAHSTSARSLANDKNTQFSTCLLLFSFAAARQSIKTCEMNSLTEQAQNLYSHTRRTSFLFANNFAPTAAKLIIYFFKTGLEFK